MWSMEHHQRTNMWITRLTEGEEKNGTEILLRKIMADSFPNLGRVCKSDRTPNKINLRKSSPGHIKIKLFKTKKLKATREKIITYNGSPIRLSLDFSTEASKLGQSRVIYSKCRNKKKKTPIKNTLYRKTVLQKWERNKDFLRQRMRKFIATKSV